MKRRAALLIVAVSGLLAACGSSGSDLLVRNAWARPASALQAGAAGMPEATQEATAHAMSGANVSAAFMVIENRGSAAEQLTAVVCDAAGRTELHQTTMENNVARMSPVDRLEIPANASLELKPGGYHIMLMDLKRDLMAGEKLQLTLKFASGKEITVEASIQETAPNG